MCVSVVLSRILLAWSFSDDWLVRLGIGAALILPHSKENMRMNALKGNSTEQ